MRGLGVEEGKKGETRREGMSMRGGRTREIEQCEKSEDLDQREKGEGMKEDKNEEKMRREAKG